jgi:hypothetical protein
MRISEIVSKEDCLVTRVWGFTPETWGALGFPKPGTAERWIDNGETLFAVCFVSHNAAPHIDPADQGRVLGIYELTAERVELDSEEVLSRAHLIDPLMRREDGELRWPVGLRATRAWRFAKKPRTREAMPDSRKLGYHVSTDLVALSRSDYDFLDQADYQLVEVPVFPSMGFPNNQRLAEPNAVPNSVYLFACGKVEMIDRLPLWKPGNLLVKVGCTWNVESRLDSFNTHPLARIMGLKLAKIEHRFLGESEAPIEEKRLLDLAGSLGFAASSEKTEFFFMSEISLHQLARELRPALRVG